MPINLQSFLKGSTTRHELSIYDSANAAIDMTGGTVSVTYTSLDVVSVTKAATLSGTPTVAPQAYVDLFPADLTTITAPTTLMAVVTATTSGGIVYKASFSQPLLKEDAEWAYGLATIAEVRESLGLTSVADDHKIGQAITAVTARIKRMCGREFRRSTYTEYYDGEYSDRINLLETPVVSIISVVYTPSPTSASTTLAATDYVCHLNTGILRLVSNVGWQVPTATYHYGDYPKSLAVTYAGGYTTVPWDLKQCCIDLVRAQSGAWGLSGTGVSGGTAGMKYELMGSYAYTRESAAEADAAIHAMLGDYMRHPI